MTKTTSARTFAVYIWLADTIWSRGPLSRQDIDSLWSRASINDEHSTAIPERTFHRYKDAVQELFGIEIRCDKAAGSLYYIPNDSIGERGSIKRWILNQFAIDNTLRVSRELRGRIVYENIPAGIEYLTQIVEAMRDSRKMVMTHQSFSSDEPHIYTIAPYCLKVFKQRWYLLAKSKEHKHPRIFALDRILSLQTLAENFRLPAEFDAERYFAPYYGVFCGASFRQELIRIKATQESADFLRSLPLHHSQEEPAPLEFTYYVAPTLDFIQELRTHGADIEVLQPQWLRDKFRQEALKTLRLYNPDK